MGVDAHDAIVGAGSEELAARGESNCVDCARVITHRGQLLGLVAVVFVGDIVDGLGRPDSNVAVCNRVSIALLAGLIGHRIPPAAVTRRLPSGDTWQLYTSWSFFSPTE